MRRLHGHTTASSKSATLVNQARLSSTMRQSVHFNLHLSCCASALQDTSEMLLVRCCLGLTRLGPVQAQRYGTGDRAVLPVDYISLHHCECWLYWNLRWNWIKLNGVYCIHDACCHVCDCWLSLILVFLSTFSNGNFMSPVSLFLCFII